MSAARLEAHGTVKGGIGQQRRGPSRARLYAFLTVATGAVAGIAGAVAIGAPAVASTRDTDTSPISAGQLFPSVSPVHKVVDVYDPAPPSRPAPVAQPAPSTPVPHSSPTPQREREHEGDGHPGGDD